MLFRNEAETAGKSVTRMIEYNIGPQLKSLRKTRNLTLQFVAERAGVSVPLLSQIENGNVTPSLKTLTKLASYYQIRMGRFFDGSDEKPRYKIFRNLAKCHENLSAYRTPKSENYCYSLISPSSGARMNCSVLDVQSNFSITPTAKGKGETFLYIIAGKAAIDRNGETYIVEPGDSVYFDNTLTIGVKPIDFPRATVMRIDAE